MLKSVDKNNGCTITKILCDRNSYGHNSVGKADPFKVTIKKILIMSRIQKS